MQYGPLMIDLQGISLNAEEEAILKHPGVGGVLLFSRNYSNKQALKQLVAEIRRLVKNPV